MNAKTFTRRDIHDRVSGFCNGMKVARKQQLYGKANRRLSTPGQKRKIMSS
jgi:hypothetical protein